MMQLQPLCNIERQRRWKGSRQTSDFEGNQCKRAIIRKNQLFRLWEDVTKTPACAVYSFGTVWAQRLHVIVIMIIMEWLSHTGGDKGKDKGSMLVVTHALVITSSVQRAHLSLLICFTCVSPHQCNYTSAKLTVQNEDGEDGSIKLTLIMTNLRFRLRQRK